MDSFEPLCVEAVVRRIGEVLVVFHKHNPAIRRRVTNVNAFMEGRTLQKYELSEFAPVSGVDPIEPVGRLG